MRSINWIQTVLVNLAVVLFILLPFLPGPSNKVIVALGFVANITGFIGLLLIPLGCYWLIRTLRKNQATRSTQKNKQNPQSRFLPVHVYLITIPIVAFCARTYIAPMMSNYSRNFAIERGQALVTSIEEFKSKEGRYPESISELKKVPAPFIMGIERFRYTRYKDEYLLSFSQWPDGGITEEIVMFAKEAPVKRYVPNSEYDYTNDYHRVMGAFASYDTQHAHWRYYLCD
ncbi:MAG: hypothetical protein JNK79_07695 [Chitinophagaceae bacterium]|nr:hypothetical protein [Chitinophagaceae bacterium]